MRRAEHILAAQAECMKRLSDGNLDFYFASLTADLVIDAGPMGGLARFANHSCSPNCLMEKWTVSGEPRLVLVADRDLAELEEITFNYSADTLGDHVTRQPCRCGAPNCAKFIGAKIVEQQLSWLDKCSKLFDGRNKPTIAKAIELFQVRPDEPAPAVVPDPVKLEASICHNDPEPTAEPQVTEASEVKPEPPEPQTQVPEPPVSPPKIDEAAVERARQLGLVLNAHVMVKWGKKYYDATIYELDFTRKKHPVTVHFDVDDTISHASLSNVTLTPDADPEQVPAGMQVGCRVEAQDSYSLNEPDRWHQGRVENVKLTQTKKGGSNLLFWVYFPATEEYQWCRLNNIRLPTQPVEEVHPAQSAEPEAASAEEPAAEPESATGDAPAAEPAAAAAEEPAAEPESTTGDAPAAEPEAAFVEEPAEEPVNSEAAAAEEPAAAEDDSQPEESAVHQAPVVYTDETMIIRLESAIDACKNWQRIFKQRTAKDEKGNPRWLTEAETAEMIAAGAKLPLVIPELKFLKERAARVKPAVEAANKALTTGQAVNAVDVRWVMEELLKCHPAGIPDYTKLNNRLKRLLGQGKSVARTLCEALGIYSKQKLWDKVLMEHVSEPTSLVFVREKCKRQIKKRRLDEQKHAVAVASSSEFSSSGRVRKKITHFVAEPAKSRANAAEEPNDKPKEKPKEKPKPKKRQLENKLPDLHCFCQLPEWCPENRELAQCDGCELWYHSECVARASSTLAGDGVETEDASQFFCPLCVHQQGKPTVLFAGTGPTYNHDPYVGGWPGRAPWLDPQKLDRALDSTGGAKLQGTDAINICYTLHGYVQDWETRADQLIKKLNASDAQPAVQDHQNPEPEAANPCAEGEAIASGGPAPMDIVGSEAPETSAEAHTEDAVPEEATEACAEPAQAPDLPAESAPVVDTVVAPELEPCSITEMRAIGSVLCEAAALELVPNHRTEALRAAGWERSACLACTATSKSRANQVRSWIRAGQQLQLTASGQQVLQRLISSVEQTWRWLLSCSQVFMLNKPDSDC